MASPVSDDAGPLGPMAALVAHAPVRMRRALSAYVVGATLWRSGVRLWRRAESELMFSVKVPDRDDIYPDVHAWLIDNLLPRQRRALTARSSRNRSDSDGLVCVPGSSDGGPKADVPALTLMYDGARTHTVVLDGHRIRVLVTFDEILGSRGDGDHRWREEHVVFNCRGPAARDAVLGLLGRLARDRHVLRRTPQILIADRWGGWNRRHEMPVRRLGTVVLPAGVADDLTGDLAGFLGSEARYGTLGLPWHRGYLLHGPAGTGKTSLARALACEFDMDLYYVPLSGITGDDTLLQLLNNVPARSMLLLEDVDVLRAAKERDQDQPNQLTLSGLLNALDGVATPHGLVTVMTTNEPDSIDEALVRKGRVDQRFELGYLDDDQLRRLTEVAAGKPITVGVLPPLAGRRLSPADLIEAVKPHLGDGPAVIGAVWALLDDGSPARNGAVPVPSGVRRLGQHGRPL